MSLYLKYRPSTLADLLGNDDIVSSLDKMLKDKTKCPHSFLLHGPTGCGKTTIGRIIATELGSIGSDIRELDSAQFRGIDMVREIRSQCQYRPLESDCRVWIIDEGHKLTKDAQSAFLKILEDTPTHVYFILCTTEPQSLLPTIKGRCSQFQVKQLTDSQMMSLLRKVVKAEEDSLQKLVYDQIIQDSLGHPRNALQILDQVLRVDEDKRLNVARRSAEEQSQSIELCRALLNVSSWSKISKLLGGLKDQEAETIRRHVLGYCQAILLKGENDRAALVLENFMEPFYNTGFPGLIYACYVVVKG